jgi:hypothetical protein
MIARNSESVVVKSARANRRVQALRGRRALHSRLTYRVLSRAKWGKATDQTPQSVRCDGTNAAILMGKAAMGSNYVV